MIEVIKDAFYLGVKAAHFLSSCPDNADSPCNVSHTESLCPYKEIGDRDLKFS